MSSYPSQKNHVLFHFTLKSDEVIIQLFVVWLFFFLLLNHFTVVRNI